MTPHPDTGAIYFVVVPADPALRDIRVSYLLNEQPWLTLVSALEFPDVFNHYRDHRGVAIHWAPSYLWEYPLPSDRRLTMIAVWSEAYDTDLGKLSPDHQTIYTRFQEHRTKFDAVACHTPWMAAEFHRNLDMPTIVLPHGWDRRAMGEPIWGSAKTSEAVFYGSMLGKREAVLNALATFGLGRGLAIRNGLFGRDIVEELNHTKCVLNIYHFDCESYSTWRLFQAACSSACLVTEPGDIWPLDADAMVVLPKRVTTENVHELAGTILSISHGHATLRAEYAHQQIQPFTIDRVIQKYIVEQTEELLR
jgi:hypothetical protein